MGVYVTAAAGLGAINASVTRTLESATRTLDKHTSDKHTSGKRTSDKHTFRVELEPVAYGDIPLNIAESYLSAAMRERWVRPLAEARRTHNADLYSDLIKQMFKVESPVVSGAALNAAIARVPNAKMEVRRDAWADQLRANMGFRRYLGARNLKPAKRPLK